MNLAFKTIEIRNGECEIVEQTLLPLEFKTVIIKDYIAMGDAIKRLAVRGAPAIGVAGAAGAYLGALSIKNQEKASFQSELEAIVDYLKSTRPTAVNLFWALDEMLKTFKMLIEKANAAIGTIDLALTKVSKQSAALGAYQNRLEFATKGIMIGAENTQAAESRIRDTDMALQMVSYSKNNILIQSSTAMLAQANQKANNVLTLLR